MRSLHVVKTVTASCLLLAGNVLADVTYTTFTPPQLAIIVNAGSATLPGGGTVQVARDTLNFDSPTMQRDSLLTQNGVLTVAAPGDYATWFDPWQPWPSQGTPVTLMPRVNTTLNPLSYLLGGLYRAIAPESVVVKSSDNSTTYVRDTDYKFNRDWGQVANLSGRMTGTIKVSYTYVKQRIDLVQVNASGVLSVKKGTPQTVCPEVPAADAGCAGLAGIYVATSDSFTITSRDIYPINPRPRTAPVNVAAVDRTRAKLALGQQIKIAFMGDSFTLGAEGGLWWNNPPTMAFRGLVRSGIPQLNPGATVQEVASSAYAGGASSTNIVTNFNTNVLPAAPDVMVACYGLNDADGAIGSAPNVAAATYKSNIQQVVTLAQSNNIDVILLSPFRPHPFYPAAIRIDQYRQAMAELATTYGAGFADLLTDWDNQAYKGLPPFAELHNNHNHPGVNGHRLAADLLLQFFNPSVGVSEPVAPPLLTNEYRIQPNPFTRSFNIDGHQGPARQAMLYDRSGRMVRTFMLTAAATTCVVPDNREHIYFMKISGVPGCMRLMRIEE